MIAAPWLFLKKKIKNKRSFELQSSELISQILPEIEKVCSLILMKFGIHVNCNPTAANLKF